ncbi:unnamed protein product [Eruca vesicaria subsp. sativa]|uniref:Neprosin PEP catalytic domain-containing protein n=1 Tax=Eruca vesicaria subsp. sativa TaxID=29727 RepID=A0ABC8LPH0_ERUVS|nr:unnamed protein product [Eruca vesicaria subsp. sativa]
MGRHTKTQIGSGHFPKEGFGESSYFHNLKIMDNNNSLQPIQNFKKRRDSTMDFSQILPFILRPAIIELEVTIKSLDGDDVECINKTKQPAFETILFKITNFRRHTKTQIGSGHFPKEGFGESSYFHNLKIIDNNNSLQPIQNFKKHRDSTMDFSQILPFFFRPAIIELEVTIKVSTLVLIFVADPVH